MLADEILRQRYICGVWCAAGLWPDRECRGCPRRPARRGARWQRSCRTSASPGTAHARLGRRRPPLGPRSLRLPEPIRHLFKSCLTRRQRRMASVTAPIGGRSSTPTFRESAAPPLGAVPLRRCHEGCPRFRRGRVDQRSDARRQRRDVHELSVATRVVRRNSCRHRRARVRLRSSTPSHAATLGD